MSIIEWTGLPGSGKTYRLVYELAKPEIQDKYMVFHNIDGLRLGGDYVKDWREIDGFLSKAKQEAVCKYEKERCNRPVLVIIDEAQLIFDKPNTDLKAWLSWHRHLGQDVWIACQHYMMIHRDYQGLIEYEVRAKKNMIVPFFLYHYQQQGEVFKKEKLPKKKEVFALYRSFDVGSAKKKGSKLMHMGIAALVIAIVLAIYFFGWGVRAVFSKADASMTKATDKTITGKTIVTKTRNKKNKAKEKEKVEPVSEWAACLVMGSMVSLCDEVGHVRPVNEALPGYKLIGIEGRTVLIMNKEQQIQIMEIKAKRAKAVPQPQARDGGEKGLIGGLGG